MTDKYAELRAALASTEFWNNGNGERFSVDTEIWNDAANPAAIRALLVERDSLGEFASAFLLWAATGANPDRLEGLNNIARAALAQGEV